MSEGDPGALARAWSLLSLGRPAEALHLLGAGRGDGVDLAEGALRVHALLQLDRAEEARQQAVRLVGAYPGDAEPRRVLALAERQRGRRRRAVAAALEALALDPDDPDVLRTASLCFREAGRAGDAVNAALRLVEVAPEWPGAVLTYAQARLALKDYPSAERAARDALALDPESGEAVSVLAGALDRQGHRQEAAALLAEAGRLDPRDDSIAGRIVSLAGKPAGIGSILLILFGLVQLSRGVALAGPDGSVAVLAGVTLFAVVSYLWTVRKDVALLSPELRRGLRREQREVAAILVTGGAVVALLVCGTWSVVLLVSGERDGTFVPLAIVPVVCLLWLVLGAACMRGLWAPISEVLGRLLGAAWDERAVRLPGSWVHPSASAGRTADEPSTVDPVVNLWAAPPDGRG